MFWAWKLWILHLVPFIYGPPLAVQEVIAGFVFELATIDVPGVLNCASCSLQCVVWAYSDSESLPDDHIESLEELCHESLLLSGA